MNADQWLMGVLIVVCAVAFPVTIGLLLAAEIITAETRRYRKGWRPPRLRQKMPYQ